MTSTPTPGRGGSGGDALSRLRRPKLAKATERSVVEEMTVVEQSTAGEWQREAPNSPQSAGQAIHAVPDEPARAIPVPVEPEPAQDEQKSSPRRKMSFAPTSDEHDRIRTTFLATRHITRYASLNDFLRAVVLAECARLEDVENGGEPFEWSEAEIPKGRPLRY